MELEVSIFFLSVLGVVCFGWGFFLCVISEEFLFGRKRDKGGGVYWEGNSLEFFFEGYFVVLFIGEGY